MGSEGKEYKKDETLTFRLGQILCGQSILLPQEKNKSSPDIDSSNYCVDQVQRVILEEYFDYSVRYFLELVFLFRRQIYIYSEQHERNFKKSIIKEIYIPQALLIFNPKIFAIYAQPKVLFDDIDEFNKAAVNIKNKHLESQFILDEIDLSIKFNPFSDNKSIEQYLPEASPLRYLKQAISDSHKNDYNFMVMCRNSIKRILKQKLPLSIYQNFVSQSLDKLSSNKLTLPSTFRRDLKFLLTELNSNDEELIAELNKCAGIFSCFSILERIKKYLLKSSFNINEFQELIKFSNSAYYISDVMANSLVERSANHEKEFTSKISKLLSHHFTFLFKGDFYCREQSKNDLNKEEFEKINPNILEQKLFLRSKDLLLLIEATKHTKQSFLLNKKFYNLVAVNCILNNCQPQLTIKDYTQEMLQDANFNINFDNSMNASDSTYQLKKNEFIDFKLITVAQINWYNFPTENICSILKNTLPFFKHHAFYDSVNEFINCLNYLSVQDITNAKISIGKSFNKLIDNRLHSEGVYIEYILSFYLGLKAYGEKPNFPALKKFAIWLNPMTTETFANPWYEMTVPSNMNSKSEPFINHYLLSVIQHFNYFCVCRNRFPQVINNPYEPIFKPLKKFIYAVINAKSQESNEVLNLMWNKNVDISTKYLIKRKMIITKFNILDILKESEKHFILFLNLFLDGVKDTEYIFALLYPDHKAHYIKNFILTKLLKS